MANIVIRSNEANAVATALLLATRSHRVCLLAPGQTSGEHHFSYFGQPRTVSFQRMQELDGSSSRVGIVFAEGENVQAGIKSVFDPQSPDLLLIIGGGISAAVEATEAARRFGFDVSRILLVGGFFVGGSASSVTAEKQGVLAGFLAPGTPAHVLELADSTFPQFSISDGFRVALSSVNALVHVPPMILNAMAVERGDDVRFYVGGFGDSVGRLISALDADRLRLGRAVGFSLLPLDELMDRYNGPSGMQGSTLREKVNGFPPYQSIKLPSDFHHRFLAHELRSTFAPMSELARRVKVDVPAIQSVVGVGEILLNTDLAPEASIVAQKFLQLMNTNLDPRESVSSPTYTGKSSLGEHK